jgi:hypothetical protein
VGKTQAIAAVGQAMLGLLSDAIPRSEFPTAQFDLYQLSNFQTPMEEGVSLYLYRIAVNTSRRNQPATVGDDGRRYRPPLPLDLHYVVSAWAQTAIKQQRLLGWTIRMFEDVSILPTGLLNHFGPEPDIFRSGETAEIFLESLTLQDFNNLWSLTRNNPPLSVGYVAKMINIESTMPMAEFAEVQTRDLRVGKR